MSDMHTGRNDFMAVSDLNTELLRVAKRASFLAMFYNQSARATRGQAIFQKLTRPSYPRLVMSVAERVVPTEMGDQGITPSSPVLIV